MELLPNHSLREAAAALLVHLVPVAGADPSPDASSDTAGNGMGQDLGPGGEEGLPSPGPLPPCGDE